MKITGPYYDVLLKDGTWFEVKRPDFSNISDTIRLQNELGEKGIHPVEVENILFELVVGLTYPPTNEVYRVG